MNTTDTDNAINQAKAQLESIQAMVARLEHVHGCITWDGCSDITDEELADADSRNSEEYHDEENALGRMQEDPLSIQVRSGWVNVDEIHTPAEFEILLCTGGPAVRIIGELDESGPYRARLQYQDWGTPWTELLNPRDMQALISYASNFYYGE